MLLLLMVPSVVALILYSGCSVVFTCSVTGTLVDTDAYDNGDNNPGISDATVYLYTDEESCEEDLVAWQNDNSIYPDNPASSDEPKYFLKTTTDDYGDYSFNGLIWNELFPEYGKSGDRKEIYLLFYHKNYGMNANPTPVYIVSDVTNQISVIELKKIMNTAEIAGTIYDADTGAPLANATVGIWIPTSWTYSSGSINTSESSFKWNNSASYTALTDSSGEWSREISYKMMPSSSDNKGTTIVRLTFSAGGYVAENAADSDIIDGGWDIDGNGTIENDEDDGYYQSGEISAGTYAVLDDISMADEYNTAMVTGTVVNSTGGGESNVTVDIYVAEDWSYTDPVDPKSIDNVSWPENPSYTVITDTGGGYSQEIEFERKPSESNNLETTRVRLVFIKDTYLINNTTDPRLTDNTGADEWDSNGNGSMTDEEEAYYDPYMSDSKVVSNNQTANLGSITIRQTQFSETLEGQVQDSGGIPVPGATVWLFFNVSSEPSSGTEPDYSDNTVIQSLTTDVYIAYFSFDSLEWTDEIYTTPQSSVPCYLYLPDSNEIEADVVGAPAGTFYYHALKSGTDNYVSLTQP